MKLDKNYKVRVTPDQSREIHSLILLDGGEVSYGLKPQLQDEFLVIENEHGSVVIYYTDQDIFLSAEQQEIQANDLIALLTKLPKSAENPLQKMELTSEFEAVEPIFKVGDKVYKYGETDVKTVLEVFEDGYMRISNYPHRVNHEVICHATPENHALLSKPFPAIEFEQPPKELTGSDLARALIKKGWIGFNCLCGNSGDGDAITDTIVTGINNGGQFTTIDGRLFNNAIPMKGWRPLKAQEVGL